jgi:hypothetical protein
MDLPNMTAGVGAAIGVAVAMWLTSRRNEVLTPKIEAQLRAGGEQTLPQLQAGLGMNGFYNRGKVITALGAMVQQGQVVETLAPDGTPMLERVNHIKYRLKS